MHTLLQLDCCGNTGYKDYLLPPKSCYNKQTDKLNMEGCRQKFLDYIAEQWTGFNIFSLVLVGVEVSMITYKYIQIFIFIHIYFNTFSDYLRPARLCAGQQYCQSLETLEILPQIGSIAARTTYATTYYTYQGQRILNTV